MEQKALESLPLSTSPSEWESEEVFNDGDEFFSRLISDIHQAIYSIDFEIYIFEKDEAGKRVLAALEQAARRGVRVRLMVDGVGSPGFTLQDLAQLEESGVQARIFKPYPWVRRPGALSRVLWIGRFQRTVAVHNRRNHRKSCIIDERAAWVGSFNVSREHLKEFSKDGAWRDTGVRVEGEEILKLLFAFERAWIRAFGSRKREPFRRRAIFWWKGRRENKEIADRISLVRLNFTPWLREKFYRDLIRRIRSSEVRIWVTMAYFNPRRKMVRALKAAARKGADVRVILPLKTDVRVMRWIATAILKKLLTGGVKAFEYLPSVLHSKTVLTDRWAIVGSTNWNHRSMIHDLEVDIVLKKQESLDGLKEQFLRDLSSSHEITIDVLKSRYWFERLLGRLFLFFRSWF